jgi:N-acetylmuramoyl-L-alanine amidase
MSKGVIFKVQIAASARSLELTKANFNGLKEVSVQKGEKLYRYFYGQAIKYKSAKKLKQKAIKAGYEHAFLVAFKDGVKINISDAISQ